MADLSFSGNAELSRPRAVIRTTTTTTEPRRSYYRKKTVEEDEVGSDDIDFRKDPRRPFVQEEDYLWFVPDALKRTTFPLISLPLIALRSVLAFFAFVGASALYADVIALKAAEKIQKMGVLMLFLFSILIALVLFSHLGPVPGGVRTNSEEEFRVNVLESLNKIQGKLGSAVTQRDLEAYLAKEREEIKALSDLVKDLNTQKFVTQEQLEKTLNSLPSGVNKAELERVVTEAVKNKLPELVKGSNVQQDSVQKLVSEQFKKSSKELQDTLKQTQEAYHQQALDANKDKVVQIVKDTLSSENLGASLIDKYSRDELSNILKSYLQQELMTKEQVSSMIEESLKRFSADEIGIPDYALASAGASIVYEKTSPRFNPQNWFLSWIYPFGRGHSAAVVLRPEKEPGRCFSFAGSKGVITIQLARQIKIESVTIDHVDKKVAHQNDTAPRVFSVKGFGNLHEQGVDLGRFEFDWNNPFARNTFQVTKPQAVKYVAVHIESNYGNPNFTCVYRIRVHGKPSLSQSK